MEDKIKNKIIALSGQPVTGKGTVVKSLNEKFKSQGYNEEKIHIISTGSQFRNYFNSISNFIKNYNNSKEIEEFSENPYLRRFSEKKEYRDALINTIIGLRNNNIDLNNFTIEQANNLKEFHHLRKMVDTFIDSDIAEKGKEINSISRPDEVWIFDSRLAFNNIPDAFAVRLTSTPEIAAERLFNDKSRGEEDSKYETIQEAKIARENRRIGEQKRYLKRYGVDLENEDNYDLIIDTSYSKIEDISDTILSCLECYDKDQPFSKKWTSPKTLLPLQREMDTVQKGSYNTLDEITKSIKEKGYLPNEAIEIVEVDDIKYIIEGHHRNFASAFLGKTLVPYEILAKNDEFIKGYGQNTARQRANSLQKKYLWGHEWFIEKGQEIPFSYNDIYPGIYDKVKDYTGEEH